MLNVHIDRKTYPDRAGRTGAGPLTLRGLELTVAAGEFVCLVGPSGCGKSTLLNLIGGLDRDFTGSVTVDGAPPGPGLGFMFQSPRLMPWLSVLDNVRLVLPETPAATTKARALLVAMELGDALGAFPGRLSGGMQRRVALARAFAVEPRLLLMDEPLVSLDAPTAERLRAMLLEQHRRCASTVLYVTHDLREALSLADRIVFLSAAPGCVVHEERLAGRAPRSPEDVDRLHRQLLRRQPALLSGLAHLPGVEA